MAEAAKQIEEELEEGALENPIAEYFATEDLAVDEDIPDDDELIPPEELKGKEPEQAEEEATEPDAEAKPIEEPAPTEEVEKPEPESEEPGEKAEESPPEPEKVTEKAEEAEPPEPEPSEQLSDEQVQEKVQEWRTNALSALEDHYKLDQETVDKIEEDPSQLAQLLPRMASHVYLDAVQMAVHSLQQQLPQIVPAILKQVDTARSSEDQFFSKWPQINRKDRAHLEVVGRLSTAYRQANPRATPEQFINDVGAQSIVSLGLLEQVQAAAQPPQEVVPVQPAFKPAGSAAPVAAKPSTPGNPFTAMDDELFGRTDLDLD